MLPRLVRSNLTPNPFPWGRGTIARVLALGSFSIKGFAQLEADEAAHFDLFAHLECCLDQQIVYGLVGIAHVSLFEETCFLIELFELALDNFADHGGRLAFGLGGVDLALLLDDRNWNFLALDAAR